MKTVEKLVDQLVALRSEEGELLKRLEENRQRQAAIMGTLSVKPEPRLAAAARRPAATKRGAAYVLSQSRPAARRRERPRAQTAVDSGPPVPQAAEAQGTAEESGAARVREYILAAADDSIITTEQVAKQLNLKTKTVSVALSRETGKLVERVPGTKRGKFRKLNRAA